MTAIGWAVPGAVVGLEEDDGLDLSAEDPPELVLEPLRFDDLRVREHGAVGVEPRDDLGVLAARRDVQAPQRGCAPTDLPRARWPSGRLLAVTGLPTHKERG